MHCFRCAQSTMRRDTLVHAITTIYNRFLSANVASKMVWRLQHVQEAVRVISERTSASDSKLLTYQKWASMDFHITCEQRAWYSLFFFSEGKRFKIIYTMSRQGEHKGIMQ